MRLLAAEIVGSKISVWLDELELDVADSLTDRISAAIRSSSFVIVCLSPHSVDSKWVQREMSISLSVSDGSVTVIPLLLQGLADEQIPAALADRIYADFRGPEKYDIAFQKVLRVLGRRVTPSARPQVLSALDAEPLPLGEHRIFRLLRIAEQEAMRGWVIDYLRLAACTHSDPTARYWIYVGLGRLGGTAAESVLYRGMEDDSPWARRGAQEALTRLGLLHR